MNDDGSLYRDVGGGFVVRVLLSRKRRSGGSAAWESVREVMLKVGRLHWENALRIVLCLLLAVVAAPARAEWVKIGETNAATHCIDPTTIRTNGNFRTVSELKDLKERDSGGEMSARFLSEYDCKEKRFRVRALTSHTKPMAGGQIVVSGDEPSQWVAIPPSTSGETRLKFVCAN